MGNPAWGSFGQKSPEGSFRTLGRGVGVYPQVLQMGSLGASIQPLKTRSCSPRFDVCFDRVSPQLDAKFRGSMLCLLWGTPKMVVCLLASLALKKDVPISQ